MGRIVSRPTRSQQVIAMPMAVPPLRLCRVLVIATVVVACAAVGRAVDIADFVSPRAAAPVPVPPPAAAPAVIEPAARPVSLRVQWGGGKPQAWTGSIAVVALADTGGGALLQWRTLCTEPDAAAMAHAVGDVVQVHERRPLSGEGIEVDVTQWRNRRLLITLQPMGTAQPPVTFDLAVEDALAAPLQKPLDGEGNRITVRQSPGDPLRTTLVPADAGPWSQVFRPGQRVRVAVDPLLAVSGPNVPVELRLRLEAAPAREAAVSQETLLVPVADEQPATPGRRAVRFAQVVFDVDLPAAEGVYDVALEAVERGSLRWARPVASRRLQLVALDDTPQPPPVARDGVWQLLHEVDPGSPRLHERLRRLPGVGLSGVSLPSVPLPAMPLPSFTRPSLPVPDVPLPSVPRLPGVSIPSMSTMVPRFNGLLTHGHSRVEPHALGPVFRLPPAADDGVPSWEGIVVANAQPGMPHAVEIEYPTDQEATFAASVFEADAAAAAVEQRHAGGFVVRREPYVANPPRMAVHRFVFWPTTKTPLVVVANPSSQAAATFGRVRVLVGPARLPAVPEPAGLATTAGRRSRRPVYGIVRSPRFAGDGGSERDLGGRAVADWATHVAGMEHEAERLVARGAAGGLVTVYADGAAAWPTTLTRHAPRWNPEAAVENTVDATPKDLLAALCRVHARAGLGLVPAVEFDAPLPALEAVIAQGCRDAVGILCLGRDGKPAETTAGPRYNILDPRVQEGALAVVRELAERLQGVPCVGGIGIVLADDGWLHLPGADWALDDATFGRFLASVGASEPAAGDRYAQRVELVQGPLRDVWLEWRADEIAAFHSRLADVVTAADPRFSLHLVPTSLFAAGPVAARFQPVLGGESRDGDLLRELGLDPLRSTRHRAIVFGMPNVHAAADGLREQGTRTAANRAAGVVQACGAAARRSLVLVEEPQPIDLSGVLPHGPFGSAAPPEVMLARGLATGSERDRRFAEAGLAGDAEIVFDETLLFETPVQSDGEASRHAYAILPPVTLESRTTTLPPLVVRSTQSAGATWVHVTNAASAPADAIVEFDAAVGAVVDATSLSPLPTAAATVAVALPAWGSRTLVIDGQVAARTAAIRYTPEITERIVSRVGSLRARRAQLESPEALEVLDNPGFEMGGPASAAASRDSVAGWELVESRRGALRLVSAGVGVGQAVTFSSTNGLATLRSNPFPPPATGRVSVAARLRIGDGDPQPPLRIALEGVQDDGEYYRFAVVGGHGGGRPLGPEWSLFVLQVDDLPAAGVESLRVRFDLLGPGSVQIDDVRVFDLAFDERQRVQLSRSLGLLEQRLRAADLGGCLMDLEGYWPTFLETFVAEAAPVVAAPSRPEPAAPQRTGSMFDRFKGWWQ